VFTLNEFGGMFGMVYAERIDKRHQASIQKYAPSMEELAPAFFKRLRLPEHVKPVD